MDMHSSMPNVLVRVPHGWWKPESSKGLKNMSRMWHFSDAQLTPDQEAGGSSPPGSTIFP
jgi:hypothetical protein